MFKLLEYGAILLCQLTITGVVRFLTFHSFIICICGSVVLILRVIFNILGLTLLEINAFQMLLSHGPSSSMTWPPATSESTIRTTIQQVINGSVSARVTWNFTLSVEIFDRVIFQIGIVRISKKTSSGIVCIDPTANYHEACWPT